MEATLITNSFPITTVFDSVKANLRLQMAGAGTNIPVLCGNPGIGKTAHVKMLADDMGYQLLYVSMNKPYEYFSGLPITNKLEFGSDVELNDDRYTAWTQPDMIHFANKISDSITTTGKYIDSNGNLKDGANGVLILLDDMQCMNDSVQKYLYELCIERSLNNFKLRSNVCMIGCMNGTNASGYDGFVTAIISRLQIIKVHMEFEYWYKNIGITLHPFISSFLRSNMKFREEDESSTAPFATYRSWTNLGLLLNEMYGDNTNITLTNITGEAISVPEKIKRISQGFISGKASDALQESISQYLSFNFDNMIELNDYKVAANDPIKQLMFGCIVNNLKTTDNGIAFTRYLSTIFDTNNIASKYINLAVSVCTNIGAISTYIEKAHNIKSISDDEYNIKKSIVTNIAKYMWSNKFVLSTLRDLTL